MHTVIGMFDNAAEAQQAAQQLNNAGFDLKNVDVARGGSSTSGNVAGGAAGALDRTGNSLSQATRPDRDPSDYRNSSGTATEGVADATGRTGDSIGSFFSNLFGGDDNDDARRYSHVGQQAGSIVTVHCETAERAHQAAEILDRAGAIDVDERASQLGYQASGMTGATGQNMTNHGGDATSQAIPIIEENLQVGKREVETGGARLRSRIVERPIEEHLRLREEHVWVERNAVNRPATEADIQSFREGQIEITEHAEVPIVNKEARVVEEIRLGKEVEERDEVIRDTVRKTEVDVERLQGGNTTNRLDQTDDQRRL